MRPAGPTFWLLDGQTGWPTATAQRVSVGRDSGIRLAADPGGPLALTSDSVGELSLPRGMAVDAQGRVYILSGAGSGIKRFDAKCRAFLPLPTVGGASSGRRQFNQARNIAIVGHNLYVADPGQRRVQVFDLESLALRHIWEADEILGIDWEPYDVTAQAGAAYVLDRRYGRVYQHRAGTDELRLVVDEPTKHNRWSRVVVDCEGGIYLLAHPDDAAWEGDNPDTEQPIPAYLDAYDAHGTWMHRVEDAGDIRDRFDVPPIRLDHKERFFLPEKLVGPGLLRESDVRDPACLARRLKQADDGVSFYLKERLPPGTKKLLDDYEGDAPPDEALTTALLGELNRLIQVERLYLEEPFKSSTWPGTAQRLRKQDPKGRAVIQLNRLLLEGAYPRELTPGCWTWLYGPAAEEDPPAPGDPLILHPALAKRGLIFDREGQPAQVAEAEPMGPRLYASEGRWYSHRLDSQIYDCQWHRIELDLSSLPPGTKLVVSTYTTSDQNRGDDDVRGLQDHLWDTKFAVVGRMQPPPDPDTGQDRTNPERPPQEKGNLEKEFLIQSQEGTYLWLRIDLFGDGYASPAASSMLVHYPRRSYLEELPAVYRADEASRRFLEQFLSIFQTEWDDLERRIDEIACYFDPKAVPGERGFLEYLASWLALPLEGAWDEEQKRRLLTAAPKILPQRGTLQGLRQYLQVYLQNMTDQTCQQPSWTKVSTCENARGERQSVAGCARLPSGKSTGPDQEPSSFPQIVEGFRERQYLMLSVEDSAELGRGLPLWSPAMVRRLQLDEFSREGEVRLVSTGDPERDLFHEFAHRFRVFVPSAWIKTDADERMLRRALDDEKPAHTQYDLCLVEPRFRVGLQSTVGLDTILGDYPLARLGCPHDAEAPASRPPRHRLGYDTILAPDPADKAGVRLNPSARVGLDTVLI